MFEIASNPQPQTLSRTPSGAMHADKSVRTNKVGNKIEKIGITNKFTKKVKKFMLEKIFPKNGKIPSEVAIDIEKPSATNFGKTFLKIWVNLGATT